MCRSEHVLEQPGSYEGCVWCTTCHGFEGSLPTDCPGEPMPAPISDRVYAGSMDFVDGRWRSIPIRGLVIRLTNDTQRGTPLGAVARWSV